MKILDMNENELKAAFQLEHKGYLISASTIMRAYGEVMMFKGPYTYHANSVPEAIYAIDKMELSK